MNIKNILLGFSFVFVFMLIFSNGVFAQNTDTASLNVVLLNQDPDPAEAGEYVELRFNIFKSGNDAIENLNFKLETEYPFYFDKSDTADRNIEYWKTQSGDDWYYTLFYKLRVDEDAIEDTYELELKYWYNNQEIKSIKKFDVRVGDNKQTNLILGNIKTSPTKLVSDTDEAQIDVEIINIGDEDAENVISTLILPDGFVSTYVYSNRYVLGTIPANSSKTATFYVDIDENLKAQQYPLDIKLEYKEKDDEDNILLTKILNTDISLKSKPKFEILDYEIISGNMAPDQEVYVKFTVKNIGSKEAQSTSIRMFKDTAQPIELKEKFDFIGDLEVGESGEAILSFKIDKDAMPKEYNFDFQLRAVNDQETYLENKTLSFNIENGVESSSIVWQVIIAIIILVLVILTSYNFGKSKGKNKRK
jgi:hypothetical protein